jgi:hypothetical protein
VTPLGLKKIDATEDPLKLLAEHFEGLYSGTLGLSSISGGQQAADRALQHLDIRGYADRRASSASSLRHDELSSQGPAGGAPHALPEERTKLNLSITGG